MGNSVQEVKEISQYITKSNDEDGFAYAINKYIF
ncbi:HAD hydrolase family protein [Cetobacterium sp.]